MRNLERTVPGEQNPERREFADSQDSVQLKIRSILKETYSLLSIFTYHILGNSVCEMEMVRFCEVGAISIHVSVISAGRAAMFPDNGDSAELLFAERGSETFEALEARPV
jgi:hypothetical protein